MAKDVHTVGQWKYNKDFYLVRISTLILISDPQFNKHWATSY